MILAMERPGKPYLTDAAILEVLSQLRAGGEHVTCAALRRELRTRTGRTGGVRRVYRLWQGSMPQTYSAPPRPVEALETRVRELEAELTSTRERAALAEHREQSHQVSWARQVDQLRQRLKAYEPVGYRPERQAEFVLNLQRQLHAARERIFELETAMATRSEAKSTGSESVEEGG